MDDMKSWNGANGGGGGGSGSRSGHVIPHAAKEVVQNLREIVKKHSDDEIYATLKDCDMDPNHAVHVLMNQDAFHEVKRRRVKRRESGSIPDVRKLKARAPVGVLRFDCEAKNANYVPKHLIRDGSAGAMRRLTNTLEDKSTNRGSVRSARFQETRNIGTSHQSSKTDASAQTSDRMGTRVTRSTNHVSNAASCLLTSTHTNTSFGHGVAKRREKPAMGLDRIDHNQEGGPCNMVALKPVEMLKYSTNNQKPVSVAKNPVGSSQTNMRSRSGEQKRTFGPYYQSYNSTRVSTVCHQLVSKSQKTLEWKPKLPRTNIVTVDESSKALRTEKTGRSPSPTALLVSIEAPTELISNLEGLKLLDEPPVFIPEHLRVPDAVCTGLNFGSFDTDFESSFSTGLNEYNCLNVEDTCASTTEVTPVQPLNSSMTDRPAMETNRPSHPHLLPPGSVETSLTHSNAVLSMLSTAEQTTETFKPSLARQERHFSFVSSAPSDDESLRGPQRQFSYDIAESQPQEVSRPNFVPFADPSPNYISPVFRPGFDVETRFQFPPSHGASKFGGNVPSLNMQTVTSPQESQNAVMPRSTLAVGQPSIPVHPYAGAQPAGVTIPPYPSNLYSYQYVPSNYAYMHAPYQTAYPGNSGYLQPPSGSSFTPSGRIFSSAGSATVKFPPPLYKLGTGSTPHTMVPAGYGGYQTTPSSFAGINSSATTGSGTSYDDMIGPPYKDNALYATSPQPQSITYAKQVDASALWVQSRDLSGMQANSFYNVHGPGQHAGYMPTQPPAHAHHATGFASYSQSAPSPHNHQLLQQPQVLGNPGSLGAGSHAVMFSQPQRGPVNWASNYSSLIRSQ